MDAAQLTELTEYLPESHAIQAVYPKVYRLDGQLVEDGWQSLAQGTYNMALIRAEPPTGAVLYRLIELHETEGPCTMVVTVLDEDGELLPHVAVAEGWRDGIAFPPDCAPRISPTNWKQPWGKPNRGVPVFTNDNGNAEWAWGTGERYYAGGETEHWFYVIPGGLAAYSDVLGNVGWLAGTNHRLLRQVWQQSTVSEPEPEPEEGYEITVDVLDADDQIVYRVRGSITPLEE